MNNIDETSYLLSNPKNADRLMKSIADYEQGLGKERKLIDDENPEPENLDSFTKDDYKNHFKLQAKTNRMRLLKRKLI